MAEIVNLRRARKARDRAAAERQAQANRARFGRSKAERAQVDAERGRTARTLDGARRDEP